jgi:hypothetical protein
MSQTEDSVFQNGGIDRGRESRRLEKVKMSRAASVVLIIDLEPATGRRPAAVP